MRKLLVIALAAATTLLAVAPSWAQKRVDKRPQQDGLEQRAKQAAQEVAAVPEEEATEPETAGDEPNDFRVYWRNGLGMETSDGNFQFRIGGRIQNDWVFWGDTDNVEGAVFGPIEDGSEFRRARLFVEGYVYRNVEFKAQYDFAGGDADFKDVYIGTRGLPANFRFGHFKEPFSIEELTSSKYITFLERGLPSLFVPSRNTGFMVHGDAADERAFFAFGVFRETDDTGISVGDLYNFTGRLAGTPVNKNDGTRLVHTAVAFTWKNVPSGGNVTFEQTPEVHLSPDFVSSGRIPADSVSILDLEGVVIAGRFSAQGEYVYTSVDSTETGEPTFSSWYLFASYWLTGERRNYDGGAFDRVTPKRNFLDGNGGLGAWEVAIRYSELDLTDEGTSSGVLVGGGELSDLTFGVNWHWNPMTRLMWNVVRSELDGVDDVIAFLWRGQIEF